MSEGLRLDTLRKIRDRLAGDRVGLVKFFTDRDVYSTLIEHLDALITEEEAAPFGGGSFTCEGCGHLTQLASQASTEKGSDYEL